MTLKITTDPYSQLTERDNFNKECPPRGQDKTDGHGSSFSTLILAINNNNNKEKGMPIERDNKEMNKTQISRITLKNRFVVLNEDEPEQEMDLENDEPKQEEPTLKKEKSLPVVIHGNSNSHIELTAKIKTYVKEKFFIRYATNRFSIHLQLASTMN